MSSSSLSASSQRNGILLRFVFYIALFAFYNEGMLWEAAQPAIDGQKFTSFEWNFSEVMQNIMLGGSACLALLAHTRWPVFRSGSLLLALFLLASMARQNHLRLEDWIHPLAWKILVLVFAVYAFTHLFRHWSVLKAELNSYAGSYSFGLLIAGLLTTYVYSRFFGRQVLWQAALGDGYLRTAKNLAEEATESIGYMLIFAAAIELCVLARRLCQQQHTLTR